MDLKINEIMELSLDDYIAMSKKSDTSNNGGKNCVNSHYSENNTSVVNNVKFGRRKGNIDDEEEDEDDDFLKQVPKKEIDEVYRVNNCNSDTGIWKGPDSSIPYLGFNERHKDLRQKLNNSINGSKEKITPIQCRLKAPNNSASRPRGIPTLLPLDAYTNKNSKNNNRNSNKPPRDNRGGFSNFQRSLNFGTNNFRQTNNGIGMNGIINGRVQRNRRQDIDSKNLRFSITRDDVNVMNSNLPKPVQNMIVETPSNYINLQPSAPLNSSFQMPHSSTSSVRTNNESHTIPVGNLTPQVEAKLSLNSGTNANTNNDSLKSLLGFQGNVSGDMMPVFANRLLDFIQNGLQKQVHKPIYDMKIQKEIHELQGKPLLYKCPGGEVVSSDGAGVNCKIIPRTSGVSLNCRFA